MATIIDAHVIAAIKELASCLKKNTFRGLWLEKEIQLPDNKGEKVS